jgi:hypothetical protein
LCSLGACSFYSCHLCLEARATSGLLCSFEFEILQSKMPRGSSHSSAHTMIGQHIGTGTSAMCHALQQCVGLWRGVLPNGIRLHTTAVPSCLAEKPGSWCDGPECGL